MVALLKIVNFQYRPISTLAYRLGVYRLALTYTLNHLMEVLPEALGIFQDVKNLFMSANLTMLNFSLNFLILTKQNNSLLL